MKRLTLSLICAVLCLGTLISCAPYAGYGYGDPYVRSGRRTGAVVGGVTGAVIGNNTGLGSWGGAAIGTAVGGLAGAHRGRVRSMYYYR